MEKFGRRPAFDGPSVLIMTWSLYGGGAERAACNLANELSKYYNVTMIYYQEKESRYPLDPDIELVRIPELPGDEKEEEAFRRRFIRMLKRTRRAVATISFMYTMNRLNVNAGGRGKVICSERNDPMQKEPENMAEISRIYKKADHVVFQSERVRDMFTEAVREHSSILPNPVTVTCLCMETDEGDRREKPRRIVNIGKLHPQKNQKMLLQAFWRFRKSHPEYSLTIYGDGGLEAELKALTSALGLQDAVTFAGHVEEIHEAISDADIFVLSSDYEGSSNALLECMMMGMACISTRCGRYDVIRDGENGLLVDIGDEAGLAAAMGKLADDDGYRKRIAAEAKRTAAAYDKEKVAQQWMQLLRRTKTYGFEDLEWRGAYLKQLHNTDPEKEQNGAAPVFARPFDVDGGSYGITEDEKEIRICADDGFGKVSDAGYDQMVCCWAAVPAKYYVGISARLKVDRFLPDGPPNGQEGFGVFIRDTVETDPLTGFRYSNMAAAGGCLGTICLFGRDGITADSIEGAAPLRRFDALNGFARIRPEDGCEMDISLAYDRGKVKASIRRTDAEGCTESEAAVCPDCFSSRDEDRVFIGFMAARGSDIRVIKDSVRVTLSSPLPKGKVPVVVATEPEVPAEMPKEEAAPEEIPVELPAEIFVAPYGSVEAAGTKEDPYRLTAAVKRCAPGATIRLLPGRYELSEELRIACGKSGTEDAQCTLTGESGIAKDVVLDFIGRPNGLRLEACWWNIEHLTVRGGMGIMIEGSSNTIRRCRAEENIETGILIRHRDIDSPKSEWPSGNLVEDCVSSSNRDPSGQNADGFACKIAAGEGNRFVRCMAENNADDGFDLFAKNREIGAVRLTDCRSFFNANGFKLGGSGMPAAHVAEGCTAAFNRGFGFTSNSNPQMTLIRCRAWDNGEGPVAYYYSSAEAAPEKTIIDCDFD